MLTRSARLEPECRARVSTPSVDPEPETSRVLTAPALAMRNGLVQVLRIGLLKTGDTADNVKNEFGDFDAMFQRELFLNAGGPDVQIAVAESHRGELLPKGSVDAVVVTGSPHSVTRPEPWTHALAAWLRDVHELGTPILGVCYGHQILADAFGGRVEENPRGYEVGTVDVRLTEEGRRDPLLGTLGERERLIFHAVHSDAVTLLPRGGVLLADNAGSEVQAFRVGDHTWGVQFHPEFTDGIMRAYVEARLSRIEADAVRRGLDFNQRLEHVRSSIHPAPLGRRLLHRFLELALQTRLRRIPG
ncbi:MAG: glutamine amidotransferase [Deltaproteobacteria bacterium]|nr:glutamine amidotransferase [Deltaproteobacteria bacterium]